MAAERRQFARRDAAKPPGPVLRPKQDRTRRFHEGRGLALKMEKLLAKIEAERERWRVALMVRIPQRGISVPMRIKGFVLIIGGGEHRSIRRDDDEGGAM